MSSLRDRLAARRASMTKNTASLSVEIQAAPADEPCAKSLKKFPIEIGFNFRFSDFLELVYLGGMMLQNGELLPPNFEYLGREQAQEFFKKLGVLYDVRKKSAVFFLGEGMFCELSKEQMFNPSNAEFIQYFVGRVQTLQEKVSRGEQI